jgi:hypothetical protein
VTGPEPNERGELFVGAEICGFRFAPDAVSMQGGDLVTEGPEAADFMAIPGLSFATIIWIGGDAFSIRSFAHPLNRGYARVSSIQRRRLGLVRSLGEPPFCDEITIGGRTIEIYISKPWKPPT